MIVLNGTTGTVGRHMAHELIARGTALDLLTNDALVYDFGGGLGPHGT